MPIVNALCRIQPPLTRTEHQYTLESKDIRTIEDELREKDEMKSLLFAT